MHVFIRTQDGVYVQLSRVNELTVHVRAFHNAESWEIRAAYAGTTDTGEHTPIAKESRHFEGRKLPNEAAREKRVELLKTTGQAVLDFLFYNAHTNAQERNGFPVIDMSEMIHFALSNADGSRDPGFFNPDSAISEEVASNG